MRTGALPGKNNTCTFIVWAPQRKTVSLKIAAPEERLVPMERDDDGYWCVTVDNIEPETRYMYRLDDEVNRPDPASRWQPDSVHEPSAVYDHTSYSWKNKNFRPPSLAEQIQYELHVGTFTPEGTFDGVATRFAYLADLGINAIELMPVAQFPGDRNWGYDGVYPYAVQNTYGGPDRLKALIDAAHGAGLAVIMDVVYNHLGPEGNYLQEFGPYFTDKYKTPWGWAINLDGAHSDSVRDYFIENAIEWFRDFKVDALRLDAIHGMFDMSARPFLLELAERVAEYAEESGRQCDLIAESDLNDSRVIRPRSQNGYGLPAQWSDDFHHSLHTLLTGEDTGYYADFGAVDHLVKAMENGYVYDGLYSEYRRRSHGNSSTDCPAEQFIVFSQDHDQVGNRLKGDRLSTIVPFEALKLAAGAVLLGPNIPMLFMGEEYREEAPFLYFVSHGDENLINAVRKGRKEEFAAFGWDEEPPDPQSEETFNQSKLDWTRVENEKSSALLNFYKALIRLRKEKPALSVLSKDTLEAAGDDESGLVAVRRFQGDNEILYIMNFDDEEASFSMDLPDGAYSKILDSADTVYAGPGTTVPDTITDDDDITSPGWSITVFEKERSE